ncbi:putative YbeD-like domain-containing protein [Tanacetum coccineum]
MIPGIVRILHPEKFQRPKVELDKPQTWYSEYCEDDLQPMSGLTLDRTGVESDPTPELQCVNTYPTVRGFTAIGTGGDDFVTSHGQCCRHQSFQHHSQGQVKQKMSSGGKYVSVNIGPVQVVSSEQVQAVYNAMKSDERMKYFL